MSGDGETIRYRPAAGGSPAALDLLDQTRLPLQLTRLVCTDIEQLHDAIVRLVVRGAPAIGIAAAYGVTLAKPRRGASPNEIRNCYHGAIDYLATSRPTAVNLFWALDAMRSVVESVPDINIGDLSARLVNEAIRIHDEDRAMCRAMGHHGAELLTQCQNVMTHCNAGGLATSTYGTALAPIYHCHEHGHTLHVYADETRPLLQGARLTAWELARAGVPVTVCTDSMAGGLMRAGKIDAVLVGSDRIAANGDVANKIGTYPLAVLARYHDIPFYVVAPTNTFDLQLASGDLIPIEQRDENEVRHCFAGQKDVSTHGPQTVPTAAAVINPAFDVTPAELITAIVTQHGIIRSPDATVVAEHFRVVEKVNA